MKDTKQNSMRRIRNLIVLFALTAVIIGVSTYAWFIGLQTVNVTSFDVSIAGTDSLQLSLDGVDWGETVTINGETELTNYEDHTNWWAGKGLKPLSSVGQLDPTSSRMMLYEKASLTYTAGGTRLLASRVENSGVPTENDGYVAFDLFIRNFTGAAYDANLDQLDEEAIYLTNSSEVTVSSTGIANTGIENSVRVAFAEIGRVEGTTTTPATIQGIDCAGTLEDVTGICRSATIWEPNDTLHVPGAISWYNTTCRERLASGTNVHLPASYTSNPCGVIVDGLAYPTYAISKVIPNGTTSVDVYDGAEYNSYTGSSEYLNPVATFTDTHKYLAGTQRPTLLTLAPNSITKLRVYIYIEGQDLDNYDFAAIGARINVAFGFTKQRFTEDDFDYDGPDVGGEVDLTPPVITLNGDQTVNLSIGETYEELGATVLDNKDNPTVPEDVTDYIGAVDTSVAGTYKVTYRHRDVAGNLGVKVRTIIVS